MLLLSDYNITEIISLSAKKLLYRAERSRDRKKVILKIFRNTIHESNEVADIINDFKIGSSTHVKGIARYLESGTYQDRNIDVIEDIDGITLEKYLRENKPDIGASVKIAIGITEILEYFYRKGIVHQDLCPDHFLINPKTLEVNLIDFSSASQISVLNRAEEQLVFRSGSLNYISPEQTGRIKGEIDTSSDQYSLGIILYEMVTGSVPFQSADALSLIHYHIANNPEPPHISDPNVPVTLSNIILKLLSKNASDRYQSPFGLKNDLQACLDQWDNSGSIQPFEIGQHDFTCRLRTPKQFYGREKELDTLRQAFEQVNTGAVQIVFVEGYSGIGKSALVHQLKAVVRRQGGIFLEGKFHQFQRNIPYFAFIQAFKEFTDFILTQKTDKIKAWKERILKAVGINGKVLTDIIPHLELLIGTQPVVPELEPNETQNRFHYIFVRFIKCISQNGHPLVIFFDDLQWCDAASSNLLKTIATEKDLQSLLFIGAYRESEMVANPLFFATLEDAEKECCHLQKIRLSPLPLKNVEEIISETLDRKIQNGQSLVDLVYDKSGGNPFFIKAFLKCLQAENILVFDFYTFEWTWEAEKISLLKFSDNIVELMTGRLQKLPEDTKELLQMAACLGYHFDVHLLMTVLNHSRQEVAEKLKPALLEDLILPDGDNYHFTHDRIQQAAYSLIPEPEKMHIHLKIGKSLFQTLDKERRSTYIFEIVNQYNAGIDLIISQEEKEHLAALNLTAGIKAKNSVAYKPSFEYLQTGISLLHPQAWKNQYELALQLYTEGIESAFLSGNNGPMEEWMEVVLQNVSAALDLVRVYETRIKSYTAQHRLLDAVQTSLQILELLNIRFPENPAKIHVLSALLKIRLALLGKPEESLLDMALMKNPYAEAATRILAIVGSAAYFAMPDLFPLFVCKAFLLMIRHGNTPYSGVVCASYGLIMIGSGRYIETGYRIGKIALALSEKFDAKSFRYQCIMVVVNLILHWKEHLKNTLEPLRKNYWNCLEIGNTEFASLSAQMSCFNSFFCGRNLKELTEEMLEYLESIQQLRQEIALNLHKIHTQAVLNLQELRDDPTLLTGKVHDEEKMMQLYKETKAETILFDINLYKLILSCLFEKYEEAQQNAGEARNRIGSVIGSPKVIIFYFYDTLTRLSLLTAYSGPRKKLLQVVNSNLKIFRKFSRLAPMNCLHKLLLMEAEWNRVMGKEEKAGSLYDRAIEEARKNEYINDLALSCELAGKFYLCRNREFIAQHYLLQAHRYYHEWGALAKVRDMEQKHAPIFEKQYMESVLTSFKTVNGQKVPSTTNYAAEKGLQGLDLHSVMKAATAISSEVQLEKLLKKLVRIAVENAGARQGYLILKKDTEFFIEAEGSIDEEKEVIVQSVPLKGNKSVPEAIVQFVSITKENLVIDNAIQHTHFSLDPIIMEKASKSILCMPIVHQGDVIGLLYFENNLITNAFTQERLEIIKLLSGQMAISLQNALNEQKKMNALIEREKLLEKINLHQQELLKTKLEIQEQTYHNISQELHDNIGQVLSLIKINLNTFDINTPDRTIEKIFESKVLLNRVMKDLRDLSKSLNTHIVDEIGLTNAIDQQMQFLRRTGLYVTQLTVDGEVTKYESQCELVLFRIVQELLNNIVKHAEATSIHIGMAYHIEKLIITVQDNGKGFAIQEQQRADNKGQGLRNIQNRIKLIKGIISFKSELLKGTTAIIELPK